MSNDNTKREAEPSPASAGSHGDKCRCNLRTRLVGDGCEHCNPEMMVDILREQIAEMRLTDEEREAIEMAASVCDASPNIITRNNAAMLRSILGRMQ